jgi:hypothetical protein
VRAGATAVFLLLATAGAAPVLILEHAVDRARECFARIEGVRGPELVACEAALSLLFLPAQAPWTRRSAERVREELFARAAVLRYLDAAVGRPDAAARSAALPALRRAEALVLGGTGRLRLDELGPPFPAPEVGALAASLGDAPTLLDGREAWGSWRVGERALALAWLEGRVERARALSERLLETAPENERERAAASVCATGGHARAAIDALAAIEKGRAERRSESFARHFGVARLALEACAALAGVDAPPVPSWGHAGKLDARPRLAALVDRRLRARHCAPAEAPCGAPVRAHAEMVLAMIREEPVGAHRLELVALAADAIDDAAEAARLLTPRDGEPDLGERLPRTIRDWVALRTGAAPFVTAETLEAAAARLAGLRDGADPSTRADDVDRVRHAAGALELLAAAAWAARGEAARARACFARGAAAALAAPGEHALARAGLERLLGDLDAARAAIAVPLAAPRLAQGDPPETVLLRAEALLERAELALPRDAPAALADARAGWALLRPQAGGSVRAHRALEQAGWLIVALDSFLRGEGWALAPLAPGAELEPPPVLGPLGGPLALAERASELERLLAVWQRWLASPATEMRAARYRLHRHRGDAPEALAAFVYAAALLADDGITTAEAAEVWLDAVLAVDFDRFSLRGIAWARAEAARWRGALDIEARWRERYRALARATEDPARAELLQIVGL